MLFFRLVGNGCVYETFGISEHCPVKLQPLLIRAVPFDNPLTAKCFIHVVCAQHELRAHPFAVLRNISNMQIFWI